MCFRYFLRSQIEVFSQKSLGWGFTLYRGTHLTKVFTLEAVINVALEYNERQTKNGRRKNWGKSPGERRVSGEFSVKMLQNSRLLSKIESSGKKRVRKWEFRRGATARRAWQANCNFIRKTSKKRSQEIQPHWKGTDFKLLDFFDRLIFIFLKSVKGKRRKGEKCQEKSNCSWYP